MIAVIKGIVFVLLAIVVVYSIILLIFDGKVPFMNKDNKKKNNDKKPSGKNTNTKTQSKSNKNDSDKDGDVNIGNTQDFLDFEDIEIFSKDNPMGVITRKNKSEFIGVLEVSGINYNLLSIDERILLEESFAKLLNGIDYPIQIYVQSRKLDIENYNNKYTERLGEMKSNIDTLTARYKFLIDNNEGGVNTEQILDLEKKIMRITNQYNYGIEIKNYMMARSTQKNILEKKYFIVITHRHNSKMFEENLTYEESLKNAFFDISNKASSIINALKRSKLDGKILNGVELAELLYSAYNKNDSSVYKVSNAIKSQFSHLYTTSVPVELKKISRELQKVEEIKEEEIKKLEELEQEALDEAASYYDLDIDLDLDNIDDLEIE